MGAVLGGSWREVNLAEGHNQGDDGAAAVEQIGLDRTWQQGHHGGCCHQVEASERGGPEENLVDGALLKMWMAEANQVTEFQVQHLVEQLQGIDGYVSLRMW